MILYVSYDMKYAYTAMTARPRRNYFSSLSAAASPLPAPLTSAQIRAARALIRWSAEDLARESALGVTTIRRAELRPSATQLTAANDLALRRALEAAGVEFIGEGENGGPGVRLRRLI
jgi:hypothetical protein